MLVYATCTTDCTTSCCDVEQSGSSIQSGQWSTDIVLEPTTYFPRCISSVTFSSCSLTNLTTNSECSYVYARMTDAGVVCGVMTGSAFMQENRKYVCKFTITCLQTWTKTDGTTCSLSKTSQQYNLGNTYFYEPYSPCNTTSYATSSAPAIQYYNYKYSTGTITTASVSISNLYTIPTGGQYACTFTSCALVQSLGTNSVQGTTSTWVSATYSGSSTSAAVTFQIDTSVLKSQTSMYLSCLNPSQTYNSHYWATSQGYVYTTYPIYFQVCSYTAATPASYTYAQNTNSGSQTDTFSESSFIQVSASTCTLSSCSIVYSSRSAQSILTLTYASSTYTLTIPTTSQSSTWSSNTFKYSCTDIFSTTQTSNSFTVTIGPPYSLCYSGNYATTPSPSITAYSVSQFSGTSNSNAQTSVAITDFFSIPDSSCQFNLCKLVSTQGTSTSYSGESSFVTTSYSGSSATVTFTINTSASQSTTSYYLMCQVSAYSASSTLTASSQIYVYSQQQVSFTVVACTYTEQTLQSYSYQLNSNGGSQVINGLLSSIYALSSTSCLLTCQLLLASGSSQTYLTFTQPTSTTFTLTIPTTSMSTTWTSTSFMYQCTTLGSVIMNTNAFSVTIVNTLSTSVCYSGSYSIASQPTIQSYTVGINSGTSDSNEQSSVLISNLFTIPDSSCQFSASSCLLVSSLGTETSQGTSSSFVSVSYTGMGSSATVTFTIVTSSQQLATSYYLSCEVPAYSTSSSIASSSAKYVFSSYQISFAVLPYSTCYTGSYTKSTSPVIRKYSFELTGTSSTSSQSAVDITQFFELPDTSCSFVQCALVESIRTPTNQGSTSSFVTVQYLGSGSSGTVTFQGNTIQEISFTSYHLSCQVPIYPSSSSIAANPAIYIYSQHQIQFAVLPQSVCYTGSYDQSSPPSIQSYSVQIYSGTSNSNQQTAVTITSFFSIPNSACFFSSSTCQLVPSVGTQTNQGAASTFVSVQYQGSGSTATVTFTIDTSAVQSSTSYYLSCQIPAYPASNTLFSSSAIYVYSINTVSFKVACSFASQTPSSYCYQQNQNNGLVINSISQSSFIQITGGSTCSLQSCAVLDSTGSAPTFATLESQSSTYYNLQIGTSLMTTNYQSNILKIQCTDNYGSIQQSNQFTVTITCSPTSVSISKPSSFKQINYFSAGSAASAVFYYDNFTSSDQDCPIISHQIVTSSSSSTSPSFIQLQQGTTQFTIKNISMSISAATTYSFYILVTAQGGATLYQQAYIQITINCNLDTISLNPNSPTSSESQYKSYIVQNSLPILQINMSSASSFSAVLKNRFQNTYSSSCPFVNYQISKVVSSGSQIQSSIYSSIISIDSTSTFKISQNTNSSFSNYLIYIQAFNTAIWGGDSQQFLIDLSVYTTASQASSNSSSTTTDSTTSSQSVSSTKNSQSSSQTTQNKKKPQPQSKQIQTQNSWKSSFQYYPQYSSQKTSNNSNEIVIPKVMNILKAKILKINAFGQVQIQFSENLMDNINIKLINMTNVDIQIIPALKRDQDTDFNPSDILFNWTTVSLKNQILTINLLFNSPLKISPLSIQDALQVNFTNANSFFVAQRQNLTDLEIKNYINMVKSFENQKRLLTTITLNQSSFVLYKSLPKQIPISSSAQQAQSIADMTSQGIQYLFLLAIFFQLLGSNALSKFAILCRSLQIVLHLPIFSLILPGNVMMIFSIILPIAEWDFISTYFDWSFVGFQFNQKLEDTDAIKIPDQTQDLGFENPNAVRTLTSIAFYMALYFIKLALAIITRMIYMCFKNNKHVKKVLGYLENGTYFGDIITIFIEGYMDIIIGGYFNLNMQLSTSSGDIYGLYFSYFIITVSLGIIPFLQIWISFKSKRKLSQESFERRWAPLYEGVKKDSALQLLYYFIYVLRRLLYLAIAFFIIQFQSVQIQLLMVLNLLVIIYVGYSNSLEVRFDNRQDLFNEWCICIICLCMLFFTDYITDLNTQFMIGWAMILMIFIMMAVNLFITLQVACNSLKLIVIKYFKLIRFHILKISRHNAPQKPVNVDIDDNHVFIKIEDVQQKQNILYQEYLKRRDLDFMKQKVLKELMKSGKNLRPLQLHTIPEDGRTIGSLETGRNRFQEEEKEPVQKQDLHVMIQQNDSNFNIDNKIDESQEFSFGIDQYSCTHVNNKNTFGNKLYKHLKLQNQQRILNALEHVDDDLKTDDENIQNDGNGFIIQDQNDSFYEERKKRQERWKKRKDQL